MANPYIPSTDDALNVWANNFNTLITASPVTYGLVAADATSINTFVSAFDSALTLASDPSTKTKATVAAKDSAKAAMLDIVRGYAQRIAHNNGVSNDDKVALGLNLPNPHKSPIPAPVTFPLLTVIGATPGQQTLRYADSTTPDKRSKPAGAVMLELVAVAATVAPAGPDDLVTLAFVTKQPYSQNWPPEDKGKTAYYYGRWVTRTGLVGPWSAVASMVIA